MSKDRILGFYDFSLCADFLRDLQIFLPVGQKPLCFLSSVQILLCWTRLDRYTEISNVGTCFNEAWPAITLGLLEHNFLNILRFLNCQERRPHLCGIFPKSRWRKSLLT